MGANEPRSELIERWRRGDPAAFESLVRTWEGPIGRFLFRMTRSVETVRDLTQELFAKVYTARNSYRDRGHFSTWIYRVALNLAHDEARRNKRQSEPYPETELPGDELPGDGWAVRNETVERVTAALNELSPPLKEVLVLRHYEDYTSKKWPAYSRRPRARSSRGSRSRFAKWRTASRPAASGRKRR